MFLQLPERLYRPELLVVPGDQEVLVCPVVLLGFQDNLAIQMPHCFPVVQEVLVVLLVLVGRVIRVVRQARVALEAVLGRKVD